MAQKDTQRRVDEMGEEVRALTRRAVAKHAVRLAVARNAGDREIRRMYAKVLREVADKLEND